MITLKEACQKVLAMHPNEYIHVVNEFEGAFMFALQNKGEEVTGVTCFEPFPMVDKKNGKVVEGFYGIEDIFQGDYKQYRGSDLEEL
jgi:hypothetical protein